MPTPFGKLVREHRIKREMLLYHMAEGLGLSNAYLSDIETGNRAIPDNNDFLPAVCRLLELKPHEEHELYMAAANSSGGHLVGWLLKYGADLRKIIMDQSQGRYGASVEDCSDAKLRELIEDCRAELAKREAEDG